MRMKIRKFIIDSRNELQVRAAGIGLIGGHREGDVSSAVADPRVGLRAFSLHSLIATPIITTALDGRSFRSSSSVLFERTCDVRQ